MDLSLKSKGVVVANEKRKRGIVQRLKGYFTAKWKLQQEIDWLEHRMLRLNDELKDADNRLEAYKDVLAALTRHHQLAAVLNQIDIDTLSKKTTRSQGERE